MSYFKSPFILWSRSGYIINLSLRVEPEDNGLLVLVYCSIKYFVSDCNPLCRTKLIFFEFMCFTMYFVSVYGRSIT
jgi:hypothetical protein